jgi:hypothetical protein
MTQVLTLRAVKSAARAAYKARRLTAQHRNRPDRQCFYALGAYCCPVGAAMTKATLASLTACKFSKPERTANSMAFDYLVEKGLVDCDDQDAILAIQNAHDKWAKASCRKGATSSVAQNARRAFLKLIAA